MNHQDVADGIDDGDDDQAAEDEVFTHCLECDDPLDAPVKREEQAIHPECDPANPPRYELGETNREGRIKRGTGETCRRLSSFADEVIDLMATNDIAYGEMTVRLGDTYIDARTWAEQPETQALAGAVLIPARPVTVAADCTECGKPLTGTVEVRGKAGQMLGVEKELTCGGCDRRQLVQGTVPITTTELVFHRAEQWTTCLTCANALVAPVTNVKYAFCVDCNWQANYCQLGEGRTKGPHGDTLTGRRTDLRDVLDLALNVVAAIDRGELVEGDFSVRLPDRTCMDAYTWATQPEIQELARRNEPGRTVPTELQRSPAFGELRRPNGRRAR